MVDEVYATVNDRNKLVKTLAMELGKDAIRVNALCPGSVAGPRIEKVMRRDAEAGGIDWETEAEVKAGSLAGITLWVWQRATRFDQTKTSPFGTIRQNQNPRRATKLRHASLIGLLGIVRPHFVTEHPIRAS